MGKATYKDAGVDLELYRDAMARLPQLVRKTHSPRVINLAGGFAGLFRLDFDNALFARHYREPVLIACSDGVGTKLKVAQLAGKHNTIGIDLVAMSVNDAVCCGAEPLFFLDYVAMSHDDPPRLEQIVSGIAEGCLQADCSLLGGETAIMPDLYAPGDYDLAGFCVGVAEQRQLIDGGSIVPGDVLIGVASSGLHSNGYSLVRRVVFKLAELGIDAQVDELEGTVGDTLLEPTRIYTRAVRKILTHYKRKSVVHGIAHITGGGLLENLERILPQNTQAVVERHCWTVPAVFPWLKKLGEIEDDEMDRVFNMGIGLVLVVSSYFANHIRQILHKNGHACWTIGEVREGERNAVWT